MLDRLYIGSSHDFRAPLGMLGFSGVLDLRDGPKHDFHGVPSFSLVNRDGDPWTPDEVNEALDFVADTIRHGKVLVACIAGMSRSACMVIGYLVRSGHDAAHAYELVRTARQHILPIPTMLDCVLAAVRA